MPCTDHGGQVPDLLRVVYAKGEGDTLSAIEHFVLDPKTSTYTLNAETIYREDASRRASRKAR